jgi:dTDP-glucose pyrophosphorylase
MPMAGEGSRFLKEGIVRPKPLIEVEGKYLFVRAIDSIKHLNIPKKYSFIVRQQHIDEFSIDSIILKEYPDASIFSIDKTTRGAVETCLMAKSALNQKDAVLTMDCDLEFRSFSFENRLKKMLAIPAEESKGGCLVSFNSSDGKYSYAVADPFGKVLKTAEKEVVSNDALVGAYFFASTSVFLDAANKLLSEINLDKPELYVSLLYNYLISSGQPVYLTKVDDYFSYGTPDELKKSTKAWKLN